MTQKKEAAHVKLQPPLKTQTNKHKDLANIQSGFKLQNIFPNFIAKKKILHLHLLI